VQILDQIYFENFEKEKKAEEERAKEEAKRAQQAAWGVDGGPPGWDPSMGPPGIPQAWEGGR
jgi:hypothetical protein